MTEVTARYHINRFRSAEDGCRVADVADVPDLRFCSAFGDGPEAAVREVQLAAVHTLPASARDHGAPIPEPGHCPTIYAARAVA
jgi:predicted RNase H-like HicB family nuclease